MATTERNYWPHCLHEELRYNVTILFTNCGLGGKVGRKPIHLNLTNIYRGIADNFSVIYLFVYLTNTEIAIMCEPHVATRNKKVT